MFLTHVFTILAGLSVLIVPIGCVDNDSSAKSIPKTLNYGAYVDKYGKKYDEVETLARANLFYARTMGIFKTNSRYLARQNNYYLKQNEFTDMTPSEVKESFASKDIDLTPVYGSRISPQMPADKFMEMAKNDRNQIREGYSQASLSGNDKRVGEVDFFRNVSDTQRVDPKELLQVLASRSDVAEQMAEILEVPATEKKDDEAQMESTKKAFKPFVPASNKNYDPSLVPSYAWADTVEDASRNFANIMMEDFMDNLDPYPTPVVPKRRVLTNDMLPPKTSVLAEVMSSIKTIYDHWNQDDGQVVSSEENVLANEDELEEGATEGGINDAQVQQEAVERISAASSGEQVKTVFDVDWRRSGCISRPKSQSKCNACYAFAALDLMEFFYCRQKETRTEFSVQYIIDCGGKSELNGCQGGKISNVGKFIQKYGIQLNAAYPYSASEQQCPFVAAEDQRKAYALKPNISGWRMFPDIQAWYKWLPKSPIIVGVNMPSDFLAYGGGVHDGQGCTSGMVHAMLLVGSGNEDGKPFWFLKNTFSESWGESGYFKLSKRAPIACFNSAVVVRANFS